MARVGRLNGDLVVPAWVRRGVGRHYDPVQAWGLKQVPQDRGPRFGLAGHPLLEQHRVRGVIHGRQRMRGRVSLVWAPRMVLPSTTTTLRPSMGPVPYVRP